MFDESVLDNPSQPLACDGDKGNTTVVVTGLSVSLSSVQVEDGGVLEVLRHFPLVPDELEQVMKFLDQGHSLFFVDFSWDGVCTLHQVLCHWIADGLLSESPQEKERRPLSRRWGPGAVG